MSVKLSLLDTILKDAAESLADVILHSIQVRRSRVLEVKKQGTCQNEQPESHGKVQSSD